MCNGDVYISKLPSKIINNNSGGFHIIIKGPTIHFENNEDLTLYLLTYGK